MTAKHRHPKILDSLIDRISHLQELALDPKTPAVAPVLTLRPDATSCPWLFKKPTKKVERDTNPAILSKHQKDAYCRCPQCWQKLGSNSLTLSTYARAKKFCGYTGAGRRLSVMTLSDLLECAVQDYLDTHEQEIK